MPKPRRRRPTRFGEPSRRRPAARRCPKIRGWSLGRSCGCGTGIPSTPRAKLPCFGRSWRARRPTRRCVLRRPYCTERVFLRVDGVGAPTPRLRRSSRRQRRGDRASYTPSTRHRDTPSPQLIRAGPHAGGAQAHAAQRRGAQGARERGLRGAALRRGGRTLHVGDRGRACRAPHHLLQQVRKFSATGSS